MKREKSGSAVWLLSTVVLALISAVARWWQTNSAFEGELRLPIRMAPASVMLTCVLIISCAALLLLTNRQQVARLPRGAARAARWNRALAAPEDAVHLTMMVAAAFLSLLAVPVLLNKGWQLWQNYQAVKAYTNTVPGGNNGVLMMITGLTSVLAFLGLLMAGRAAYRDEAKGRNLICLPAINGCVLLMETYRSHAADPVLWDYVPMLLAVVLGMLFYMDCAGLSAGEPHPLRTLWLAGMTVVLSAVALAAGWELGTALLLAAQILAALAVLRRLPLNLENPPAIREKAEQAEEIQEEEPHE